MTALREFSDANEMMAHYSALKAKMRSLKPPPPKPKPRIIAINDLTPGKIPIHIDYIGRPPPRYPSVGEIATHVAKHYGYSFHELISQRRQAPICHARLVTYYLCKELTLQSYPQIAKRLGGREHSTLVSGVKSLLARMRRDSDLAMEVAELERDARRVLA